MKRLFKNKDGASAIEFALIGGILCMLLLGIADFGIGFWEQMQVASAAQAGADYVQNNVYSSTSVQNAAQNATNLSGITVSSSTSCGCPTSTGVTTGLTCGTSCSGTGLTASGYVSVSTQINYTTLFPWPWLNNPITLTGTAVAACLTNTCT